MSRPLLPLGRARGARRRRRWPGSACSASSSPTTRSRPRPRSPRSRTARFALFLELSPAYGGSLIMRAPFALAADALGGGRGRGLPRRRDAVPAGRRRARRRARLRACSRGGARPRHDRDRGRAVRGQPDHAARARHRPPRGAARRRAVRRRGARRAARARRARRRPARAGDRQQGVGGARDRAGAAGAARRAAGGRSGSRAGSPPRSCCRCCWPRRRAPSRAARRTPTRSSSRGRCGGSSARPARSIRGGDGLIKEGYRAAPGWLSPISHPLIVLVAVPLSLLAWRRRSDPLLLLALLFMLRCVLDPWNTAYYALPAIIALVLWEATRTERPPVFALALTMATWATWEWVVPAASADVESLVYLGLEPALRRRCWRGGSTRRRCPRCRRSAAAAARASGARRSSARSGAGAWRARPRPRRCRARSSAGRP